MRKETEIKPEELIEKKISSINTNDIDGCIIVFEDSTKVLVNQSTYPDGTYSDTKFYKISGDSK